MVALESNKLKPVMMLPAYRARLCRDPVTVLREGSERRLSYSDLQGNDAAGKGGDGGGLGGVWNPSSSSTSGAAAEEAERGSSSTSRAASMNASQNSLAEPGLKPLVAKRTGAPGHRSHSFTSGVDDDSTKLLISATPTRKSGVYSFEDSINDAKLGQRYSLFDLPQRLIV